MANKQEENVTFVQIIESHSCLYDIAYSNYTRQDIKEKACNYIFFKKQKILVSKCLFIT